MDENKSKVLSFEAMDLIPSTEDNPKARGKEYFIAKMSQFINASDSDYFILKWADEYPIINLKQPEVNDTDDFI